MSRSPVRRQNSEFENSTAEPDGVGSRVDAWLAAAREREAVRLGAVPAEDRRPGADRAPLKSLADVTAATERWAAETMAPQTDMSATLHQAVDGLRERLSFVEAHVTGEAAVASQTLEAVKRLESRLSIDAPAGTSGSEFDAALRSFESRLGQLTDHVSSMPKPIGRRGLAPGDELKGAVAQIRSRQAELDVHPAMGRDRSSLPALGTLARSQTAILTTLKDDVARLSNRVEAAVSAPPSAERRAAREAETAREPGPDLATRQDLDRLEESIRALTAHIGEMRPPPPEAATTSGIESLHAEIRRLADQRPTTDLDPISRDLEAISQKIDDVATGGVDRSGMQSLSRQIAEVRETLAQASAPQALTLVDAHLDELRREMAAMGGRQIDGREFTALKAAVEDIHGFLASGGHEPMPAHEMAQAVRDVGQPIESMLMALVEKLDRVERQVSDPEALDHLERKIQDLASRMSGQGSVGGLSVGGLETSIAALMQQVEAWRHETVDVAERAARTALAETVGSLPTSAEMDRHLTAIQEHYAVAEGRLTESLSTVHATLEHLMRRLSNLDGGSPAASVAEPAEPAPETRRRKRGTSEAKSDRKTAAAATTEPAPGAVAPDLGEILLEPGSARPSPAAPRIAPTPPAPGEGDVKSSFIAAARRAAQAAAETNDRRPRHGAVAEPARAPSGFSPGDLIRRIRRMIDEKRRPLLLSAAALVLALGTMQLARKFIGAAPSATPVAGAPAKPAGSGTETLASRPAARSAEPSKSADLPDPTTTQSIGPKLAAAPPPQAASPEPVAERRDEAAKPAPAGPAPAGPALAGPALAGPAPAGDKDAGRVAAASSGRPAVLPSVLPVSMLPSPARAALPVDPSVAPSAGLRQAALTGIPAALYEMAVRTAEGRGVPRDPKAAFGLFEKAAEKGLAPAQYRVGNAYERGVGVPRDLVLAKTWYRRAAESGNVRAMHNLAVLTAESQAGSADLAAAIGWFTKAADHGVRDSQFNLAVLYARGMGVAQNLGRSYFWLAVAASQGDEDAGRKRDEVGGRLPAAELAKAKGEAERWRAVPANPAANDVATPPGGWPEPTAKRREARV